MTLPPLHTGRPANEWEQHVERLESLIGHSSQWLAPSGDLSGAADTAAIQAREDAGGSPVYLGPGTFWVTGLVKRADSVWQGAGRLATTLALADGANTDVIVGDGFAGLTLTGDTAGGIGGWAIRDLSIEGNKANQSAVSYGIRVYGYNFDISRVSIANCVSDGLYTEWADFGGSLVPGATMEARYDGIKIHDCGGNGWLNRGPHDSRAVDVTIFNTAATGYGYWAQSTVPVSVAAGSDGVDLSGFTGAGVLHVSTTLGYPTAGRLSVSSATGPVSLTYTGVSATSFTGVASTAASGATVSTGAAVSAIGGYSAAGTALIGCHVWGSPLWDYVLDTQSHLIDCVGEVSAAGGGQVLLRGPQCQITGGLYVIYAGFTPNGCGIQLGDANNPVTGVRVDTILSGFTGADAGHAALNIANDGGSSSVDAVIYQPTGTAVFGTANAGYSRYRVAAYGGGSRGANADAGLQILSGRQVIDVPGASQAWCVTHDGGDLLNLNTSGGRLEIVNGLLTRWYDGPYSGVSVEIDGASGHISVPGTTAPAAALVPAAIGSSANGAAVVVNGNDVRGQITLSTASTGLGSFPATAVNFSFARAWSANPQVVITAADGPSAALQPFANAFSTTQFLLGFAVTPAVAQTYYFSYQVIG